MTREVVVDGRGLHTGEPARVVLRAQKGPITIAGVELRAWRAAKAERSTKIACGAFELRTVEHLFSALAGLGVHRGVAIDVEGPELPIVDGAASAWVSAIRSLEIAPSAPPLRVIAKGEVNVASSTYAFTPSDRVRLLARVELGDERLAPEASWDGDAADYASRIATARTFAFEAEVDELAARGLAKHVPAESVVVIGKSVLASGRAFESDEPARHKLLDLMGDLFLYGGPPVGEVTAFRPGHGATHEAMKLAIERGWVARD